MLRAGPEPPSQELAQTLEEQLPRVGLEIDSRRSQPLQSRSERRLSGSALPTVTSAGG
jgi:hypothetical protein